MPALTAAVCILSPSATYPTVDRPNPSTTLARPAPLIQGLSPHSPSRRAHGLRRRKFIWPDAADRSAKVSPALRVRPAAARFSAVRCNMSTVDPPTVRAQLASATPLENWAHGKNADGGLVGLVGQGPMKPGDPHPVVGPLVGLLTGHGPMKPGDPHPVVGPLVVLLTGHGPMKPGDPHPVVGDGVGEVEPPPPPSATSMCPSYST